MASPKGRLSASQLALAQAFFRHTDTFFLTGGAVLAGWELAHRTTGDLDLFTDRDEQLRVGESALAAAAQDLGGNVEVISSSPDFRRALVSVGAERLKVDLVRDRAPQLFPKVERDGVRMDQAQEIFVNKICTLVERSEIRDAVDLMLLERQGFRVETSLPLAQQKDGGVTPAVLAWLLSSLPVPSAVPGGISAQELRTWLRDLEQRMLALGAPKLPAR